MTATILNASSRLSCAEEVDEVSDSFSRWEKEDVTLVEFSAVRPKVSFSVSAEVVRLTEVVDDSVSFSDRVVLTLPVGPAIEVVELIIVDDSDPVPFELVRVSFESSAGRGPTWDPAAPCPTAADWAPVVYAKAVPVPMRKRTAREDASRADLSEINLSA